MYIIAKILQVWHVPCLQPVPLAFLTKIGPKPTKTGPQNQKQSITYFVMVLCWIGKLKLRRFIFLKNKKREGHLLEN